MRCSVSSDPEMKTSWKWQEWLDSRDARRSVARMVGDPVVRRRRSSSDKRLKALFNGERGPAFIR